MGGRTLSTSAIFCAVELLEPADEDSSCQIWNRVRRANVEQAKYGAGGGKAEHGAGGGTAE
eukprot:690772-Prymnesium_polylepis.1